MNKLLMLAVTILLAATLDAQNVAINTDGSAADNSAMLEIKSTTKGFLVPRVTAAQKTAIASPATGLLIYQTDGTAGFWYYNGSVWVNISTASAGWSITGNSGTTAGTNFIGTTDGAAFMGKVNNMKAFYLEDGTNSFFGLEAGNGITTGTENHFEG
ncbi:MAG: hypothetical protein WBP43_01535, partial [Chitinophagales bacterium]